MNVTRSTPTSYAVTLAEAKNYLRLDHTADDDYIENILIPAVQHQVEQATGRALTSQTVQVFYNEFSGEEGLPFAPATSIVTITDKDGADISESYELNGDVLTGTESSNITVTYTAGYATVVYSSEDIVLPAGLKDIVLSMCAHRYINRGDNTIPVPILMTLQMYTRLMPL